MCHLYPNNLLSIYNLKSVFCVNPFLLLNDELSNLKLLISFRNLQSEILNLFLYFLFTHASCTPKYVLRTPVSSSFSLLSAPDFFLLFFLFSISSFFTLQSQLQLLHYSYTTNYAQSTFPAFLLMIHCSLLTIHYLFILPTFVHAGKPILYIL